MAMQKRCNKVKAGKQCLRLSAHRNGCVFDDGADKLAQATTGTLKMSVSPGAAALGIAISREAEFGLLSKEERDSSLVILWGDSGFLWAWQQDCVSTGSDIDGLVAAVRSIGGIVVFGVGTITITTQKEETT